MKRRWSGQKSRLVSTKKDSWSRPAFLKHQKVALPTATQKQSSKYLDTTHSCSQMGRYGMLDASNPVLRTHHRQMTSTTTTMTRCFQTFLSQHPFQLYFQQQPQRLEGALAPPEADLLEDSSLAKGGGDGVDCTSCLRINIVTCDSVLFIIVFVYGFIQFAINLCSRPIQNTSARGGAI